MLSNVRITAAQTSLWGRDKDHYSALASGDRQYDVSGDPQKGHNTTYMHHILSCLYSHPNEPNYKCIVLNPIILTSSLN